MLPRVNLQSLYGAGPISLHFLHEEWEHTRGSWDLCELVCPDCRESQGSILSQSGGLPATAPVEGSLTEVKGKVRNGERGVQGVGSWDGIWGILGAALLSLSELWCSATASSETWLHRQEFEPHSWIPKR